MSFLIPATHSISQQSLALLSLNNHQPNFPSHCSWPLPLPDLWSQQIPTLLYRHCFFLGRFSLLFLFMHPHCYHSIQDCASQHRLGDWLSGFPSGLYTLLTVWPWESWATFLCLNFLNWTMGIIIIPSQLLRGLHESLHESTWNLVIPPL